MKKTSRRITSRTSTCQTSTLYIKRRRSIRSTQDTGGTLSGEGTESHQEASTTIPQLLTFPNWITPQQRAQSLTTRTSLTTTRITNPWCPLALWSRSSQMKLQTGSLPLQGWGTPLDTQSLESPLTLLLVSL